LTTPITCPSGSPINANVTMFGISVTGTTVLAAELLGLVEVRLRVVDAHVERHVPVAVVGLADPAADPDSAASTIP
jgi:hypothetical protein